MIELPTTYKPLTQQRVYRSLLDAHSFPGRVIDLEGHLEDQPALLALLATLLDHTTTLYDAEGLVSGEELLRLEARRQCAEQADYVLFKSDLPPPADFVPRLGDVYQPHLGATLILQVDSVASGDDIYELTGPGIETTQRLALKGLHPKWFERRRGWVADYPMGVDLVLCDQTRIAALPRTTHINRITGGEEQR